MLSEGLCGDKLTTRTLLPPFLFPHAAKPAISKIRDNILIECLLMTLLHLLNKNIAYIILGFGKFQDALFDPRIQIFG